MLEKSYLPNFKEEIFTVYKRMARQVPVYKLKDDAGEILDEHFMSLNCRKLLRTMMCTASKRFCGRESVKE